MRDFFIRILGKLINIFVVLGFIAVAVGAIGAAISPMQNGMAGGGVIGAVIILIGGALYISFVAGFMYLGLGIYHNTRRTADAVEKLAARPGV